MTADETHLVQRARAGDSQAFGDLVLAHQAFAYNLALRALGDPDDAQDLAQEAFLRAWQGLAGFRGAASFRTWLYRIVMNLCYNRAPQLKREMAQISLDVTEESVAESTVARIADPGYTTTGPDYSRVDPESAVEAGEVRAFLHCQIDALPSSYRLLVLLRYQQELSYEEIAEVMGMPLGSVKTGLFRAHARLKAALLTVDGLERPDRPGRKSSVGEEAKRPVGSDVVEFGADLAREEVLYG